MMTDRLYRFADYLNACHILSEVESTDGHFKFHRSFEEEKWNTGVTMLSNVYVAYTGWNSYSSIVSAELFAWYRSNGWIAPGSKRLSASGRNFCNRFAGDEEYRRTLKAVLSL